MIGPQDSRLSPRAHHLMKRHLADPANSRQMTITPTALFPGSSAPRTRELGRKCKKMSWHKKGVTPVSFNRTGYTPGEVPIHQNTNEETKTGSLLGRSCEVRPSGPKRKQSLNSRTVVSFNRTTKQDQSNTNRLEASPKTQSQESLKGKFDVCEM